MAQEPTQVNTSAGASLGKNGVVNKTGRGVRAVFGAAEPTSPAAQRAPLVQQDTFGDPPEFYAISLKRPRRHLAALDRTPLPRPNTAEHCARTTRCQTAMSNTPVFCALPTIRWERARCAAPPAELRSNQRAMSLNGCPGPPTDSPGLSQKKPQAGSAAANLSHPSKDGIAPSFAACVVHSLPSASTWGSYTPLGNAACGGTIPAADDAASPYKHARHACNRTPTSPKCCCDFAMPTNMAVPVRARPHEQQG